MIRRYWLYALTTLVAALIAVALGFWLWTRPAPQAQLEHLSLQDGSPVTRTTPGTQAKARVLVAVSQDQTLSDKQLLDLSQSGSAQLVQVIIESGCFLMIIINCFGSIASVKYVR